MQEYFFTWSTVLDLQFFKGKALCVGWLKSANSPRLMILSPSIQACDEPCLHQQRENYHMKPNIWPMLQNRSLQMQGAAWGVFVLRVHYDRRRWRKKKEEYQRKKKLVEFFFVFIGHLIELQTHWFCDQILPLTIAILHHHSCCLGNSLLSFQRHHRYHQLLPTLLQHLAKQQDPKIRFLSHNRTVDETIADERLSVVRLRSSSPGYPPKHTWFFI